MKKYSRSCPAFALAVSLLSILAAPAIFAAQLREAHVTQIVQDVQLLPAQATARAATLSDVVRDGTAVRTGTESRSELTFVDQSIVRLGANTIFSFNEGTRNLDLGGGAVLLSVPKNAGNTKITTAAVTAAITGCTVMVEYHKNAFIKFIVLEGTGRMYLRNRLGESVLLRPGQMLIVRPDARSLPDPVDVDLKRLVETSILLVDFPPLPNWPYIAAEIRNQRHEKGKGTLIDTNLVIFGSGTLVTLIDPTQLDVIDREINARPGSRQLGGNGIALGEIGPLNTITSPNPYVMNSTTHIVTAPTITTNGKTDQGRLYRGIALDGHAAPYFFGSTSTFDTNSGFDEEFVQPSNLPIAAFKFNALQLRGGASVTIPPGGALDLAFISIGPLTSAPGGIISFPGIDRVLFATQGGAINLTSDVTFADMQTLTFYARGSGSTLTLASPVQSVNRIELYAEDSIQVNGAEDITSFFAITGQDFLTGTGHISAQSISLRAFNTVNFTLSQFAVAPGVAPSVLLVGETVNIDARNDQTVFSHASSIDVNATTINFTGDPAGTTILFSDPAVVNFSAGVGGIIAPEITFDHSLGNNSLNMSAGGSITAAAILGGDFINAGGNLTTTTGDLIAIGSVSAGAVNGIIDVAGRLMTPQASAGGNITADQFQVQNINPGVTTSNTTLSAGAGGITPFFPATGPDPTLQHTFNVFTVESQTSGINFSGAEFGFSSASGGRLTINATSQVFSDSGGISIANFNGADTTSSAVPAGDGGIFMVNTTGALTVGPNALITATTGLIPGAAAPSGTGGTVDLSSTGGTVTIDSSTIQVSSGDAPGANPRRSSAAGGAINLSSGVSSGVAINVTSTAQLLSLLEKTAPGPGGIITLTATATSGSSQINVTNSATTAIEADRGGIDIRNMNSSGVVNVTNANMRADIIKIATLGDSGVLNIGGGTISADTTLKLYAGTISNTNNATINFVASCTLSGKEIDIAAATVNILQNVTVTTVGSAARVFTNTPNYQGFGGSGGATTGTFGGLGATTSPLLNAPALGPPGH